MAESEKQSYVPFHAFSLDIALILWRKAKGLDTTEMNPKNKTDAPKKKEKPRKAASRARKASSG